MLFAFDLDNTIVRADYDLPKETIKTVQALRDAGHLVTVLTGRPHAAATEFLELLGVTEHYSTNHGALITGAGGETLRRRRIEPAQVAALLSPYQDDSEVFFSCVVDDTLYVQDPEHERWNWAHTQNRNIARFEPGAELHADKIVFSGALGDTISEHVKRDYPDFVTYPWDDGYLEVTGADADKGMALALLAGELGVEQKDVTAFGDGPNDVTMLKWAGYSLAVGPNAHPDVIAAADEHIASPEELGVTRWLEENVLQAVKG